ncbi:MAG: trans-aconitate 2-methyltransferase [Halobacteriaceae archaeon]
MDDPERGFDDWADAHAARLANASMDDEAFYRQIADEADGPVLEVGCGTGRIYLALLAAGVEAYGIDVSEAVLDVLRAQADARGLTPHVRRADMRTFEPQRQYAMIVVPFRTFLHNRTVEDQQAALDRFRDALDPGGRLVLNFFVPSFEVICERYGTTQTESLFMEGEEYEVTTRTELVDEIEQVARTERVLRKDGDVIREASFELSLLPKQQFEILLETTGYADWTV